MSVKKKYSDKRTSQSTISISPALKEKIQDYVKTQNEENKDDKIFKSVSAFYNYIMEEIINLFQGGKSLKDFRSFVDGQINEFFDSFTFKASIPYYEAALRSNRYSFSYFNQIHHYFFAIRNLFMKNMNPSSNKEIKAWIDKMRNFFLSNNITRTYRMDLFSKEVGGGKIGIFEYVGLYENLHFENCKMNAAIFGAIGIEITDVKYSNKDMYCRFDLKATNLFYEKKLLKRNRFRLINKNLKALINYKMVVNDKANHLWNLMADDMDLIIKFNGEKVKQKWIDLIEKDFKKYGNEKEFPLLVLKFFEKLHWISIDNEDVLQFHLNISKEKNIDEYQFIMENLSKYGKISVKENHYYLE